MAVATSGVLSGVILTQITAGYYFTCALSSTGSVYCWGRNTEGELGNGATTASSTPVAVSTSGVLAGITVTQITSDAGQSECALGSSGAAYCWGYNSNGQLGNNTVSNSSVPVAVSTSGVLSGVTLTQVSSGTNSTCALSSTGAAYCWGGNSNGQLGNSSTAASPVPVAVSTSGVLSGVTVTQVSAGNAFACAVGGTGAAYCWGYNASGQLGNASTTSSSVPVAVTTSGALSGVTVTQVSAGASYTCALGGTGAPYCWGLNGGGQLGNGSITTSSVPVAVTTSGVLSGVTVTQVSAGNTVACAVGSTGAYCWGANGSGQAGDGTTTQRNAPVQVLLLSPGAPTGVTATAGDTTAVVSWTAPASLGTGTLTGYTATAQPGGASCSTTTMGCTITGLTDGTAYSVTVVTRTTDGNSAPSPAVSVTPASCLTSPYSVAVAADSPALWYPLNDTAGTTARDYSATPHNGIYQGGVTLGAAGPTTCGTAATFNGSTGYVSNANTITSPATFSIEVWFKATTTGGGLLVGFGNAVTGASGNYDRHIYMNNAGQVYFGVASNQTVHSTAAYNNGSWHQAVGTEGPAGLQLYIDGALVASASTPTSSAQTYTGSWRVGYDSLGGWTSNPQSNYFAGSLAEASFYNTQLSAARVAAHYAAATSASLTITATANASSVTPGSVVGYTVTVTNTGAAPYTGATFTDSLSGVLDDASYNGDAAASAGSLSYVSPGLTWTGNLAAGATVTVTFSVTVNSPDTGDKVLVTAVTSPTPGSNCPASAPAPAAACGTSVTVLVPGLTIVNSAGVASATPGSVVRFTVTITDTGQTSYTGISVTDSLSGLVDDAAYDGDASATAGSVSYASPVLTWTGSLVAGAVVTVTFSVTVKAVDTGDKILGTTVSTAAAGSNCGAGGTDARCSSSVPVLIPGLDLTVTAGTSSAAPGSVVGYTIVAVNTGQTADTGVSFTASLAGVLDDASYDGNAAATAGTVSYVSPVLSWTGTLAAGARRRSRSR